MGIELLESGGWEALTITEVCRRSGVSAPTIYARVDGRQGLFDAVYEVGMARVRQTEIDYLRRPFDGDEVELVAMAMWHTFDTNLALLRAVIRHSSSSDALLKRGSEESRRMLAALSDQIHHRDRGAVDDALKMMYAECVLRVMYGPGFLSEQTESADEFVGRMVTMTRMRLGVDGTPVGGPAR